jgi:molecular chaperone DnaK
VDVVLLVGGSSQIPYVQQQVKAAFGTDKVAVHPRPMYAVAEGAAIVAAGQTDKVTTVSRDYFIKLVDDEYKVISQGDILPVTTSHTLKIVADGQRLIHFQFFSPDRVRQGLDGGIEEEIIGDMWLGLEEKYPAGTEIQVYLELDEKNNDLRMTAHLKNDPSARVSCTFSRGRSDEKIYQNLEEAIARLNTQDLTAVGVEEVLRLAVPVVKLANQIIEPINGEERIDLRDRAQTNLQKFQVHMSNERLEAQSLINECDRVLRLCSFMVPKPQQERLQKLNQELEEAVDTNDISKMQYKSEDTERELRNLPDNVKLVQVCLVAMRQASEVAPTQASAMSDKFFRMLDAMEKEDGRESDRLWGELQPDVKRWFNKELPSNTIATGLKR